jgi:hypothetical protein
MLSKRQVNVCFRYAAPTFQMQIWKNKQKFEVCIQNYVFHFLKGFKPDTASLWRNVVQRDMNNVISHSWLQFWSKNCKEGRTNLDFRRKFGLGRRNSGRSVVQWRISYQNALHEIGNKERQNYWPLMAHVYEGSVDYTKLLGARFSLSLSG